jgi:large subunit ribosomal protein L22
MADLEDHKMDNYLKRLGEKSKGAVEIDKLYVKSIHVDQGPTQRRFLPRAMGRATRVNKKSSHVHVVLSDEAVKKSKK